jgi:hypothetical protein
MTASAMASRDYQESKSLIASVLKITPLTSQVNESLYNDILNSQSLSCVSEQAKIGKKNVYEMTEDEIKQELNLYSDFTRSERMYMKTPDAASGLMVVKLEDHIKNEIIEASKKTHVEKMMIYQNILLDIRMRKMRNNYIGQLQISATNLDGRLNHFAIDVDSSADTVSTVLSQIRDKLKVDPTLKCKIFFNAPLGKVPLINIDRTIADYKIPNNGQLSVIISQLTLGGRRKKKPRTMTKKIRTMANKIRTMAKKTFRTRMHNTLMQTNIKKQR